MQYISHFALGMCFISHSLLPFAPMHLPNWKSLPLTPMHFHDGGKLFCSALRKVKTTLRPCHWFTFSQERFPPNASSTLYLDGIPLDMTAREAEHIFRPVQGFQVMSCLLLSLDALA
eukprot:478600-Pelagomonas_calceolata.AAC.2